MCLMIIDVLVGGVGARGVPSSHIHSVYYVCWCPRMACAAESLGYFSLCCVKVIATVLHSGGEEL